MLVRVLRTFGNKIEGKRVRAGSILNLDPARVRSLNQNVNRIKLVEPIDQEAEATGPLDKPGRKIRSPVVRQIPIEPPAPVAPNPKAITREKFRRERAAKKVETDPPAPQRLRAPRGGQTGAAAPAASSPAAPAPLPTTIRQRGSRSPASTSSPSTTAGD